MLVMIWVINAMSTPIIQGRNSSVAAKTAKTFGTNVSVASLICVTACTSETITESLEKIPLTHAAALQKYQHLGQRESLKIALLEVSKQWKLELYCHNNKTKLPDKKQGFWSRWFAKKEDSHRLTHPSYLVYSPAGVFAPWAMSLLESVEDLSTD